MVPDNASIMRKEEQNRGWSTALKSLRRWLLPGAVLVALAPLAMAQDYGVKAGIPVSTLTGQGALSWRPGLQIGGFAAYGNDRSLRFKAELLVTHKGSYSRSRDELRSLGLTYVELPLMFNILITPKLYLNLGFAPSTLLAGTYRYRMGDERGARAIANRVNRWDYSTLIGAEYWWKNDRYFGVRYNHSFVHLQGFEGSFFRDDRLPFSRSMQFYVGYKLKTILFWQ
jgi:hypothetical protein